METGFSCKFVLIYEFCLHLHKIQSCRFFLYKVIRLIPKDSATLLALSLFSAKTLQIHPLRPLPAFSPTVLRTFSSCTKSQS